MSQKNKKRKKPVQKGSPAKAEPARTSLFERVLPTAAEFKKRLPTVILLSLLIPVMLCVVCPFEIYASNLSEFTFSLGDFLPLCLVAALLLSLVLFAVLMLLRGIGYDIGCGVTAWLSLMFFLQRNFLNRGINALAGDGVGTAELGPGDRLLNLAIWLLLGAAILAAVILLRKKQGENMRLVLAVLAVALLGAQLVSFLTLSLTTDVYTPVTVRNGAIEDSDEVKVLTYRGVEELSKGNNVVFFLVDRFDAKYVTRMESAESDYFEALDGFTYFQDYTSLYCRTYPAVTSILTGLDHDFTQSKNRAFRYYFDEMKGGNLAVMKEQGYDIALYTEKGYVYNDATVMDEYVLNTSGVKGYYIDSHLSLSFDMIRLAFSEYLPLAAKGWAGYLSTPDFNAHAKYDGAEETEAESGEEDSGVGIYDEYIVDESGTALLSDYLDKTGMKKVSTKGRFTFIHLYGCHNVEQTTVENVRETFSFIYDYLEEMKRLGLYEDATIVITGDHAAALSDSKMIGEANKSDDGTRVTAMFFKPAGESGSPLKHSAAQVSQDELWNTIWASEKLPVDRGRSFFEIPEDEERVRRYLFEMYKNPKNNDLEHNQLIEFKITGTALDGENWEIVSRTDIIK